MNIVLLVFCVPTLLAVRAWTVASGRSDLEGVISLLVRLIPVGALSQVVFYYHELYNLQIISNFGEQLWRLLRGAGIAVLVLALVYWLVPGWSPGRGALLALVPSLFAVVLFSRVFALPGRRSRLAIIGREESLEALRSTVEACAEWNMELIQTYDGDCTLASITSCNLDRVIVCADIPSTSELIECLTELKMRGVRVESAARFYEQATGRVPVDEIRPEWIVFSSGFENGRQKRLVKRLFDLIASSLLLIPALPCMLLASLVILLERKGPVLFCQDRVGIYGKTFRIFKFRTMVPAPTNATPQWTVNNDKRITLVGQVMRTFRIDELPQLFNVLRGEMSLVGPRPEQPYFCELLAAEIPFYHQRHTIPPGLTGWAQVRYQYGASIEESKRKLEFDLFYVKHLSVWLDFAILFETLKVVLVGRGAK